MANNTPRGVVVNNLGNIRVADNDWLGKITPSADPEFETFDTVYHGLRALAKILKKYYTKHGLRTVQAFVERYAPSKENDVEAYVRTVCRETGTRPREVIDLGNPGTFVALMRGIIRQEVGFKDKVTKEMWVSDFDIAAAIKAA